ncbi:MAG: TlpA family protein disulfide reductase [Mangrovibacterium sp.]
MNNRKKILTLVVLLSGFTFGTKAGSAKTGTEVGDKAPEISERSLSGEEMKLSALKGKLVLIDFWASWCPPCRRENPTVVAAYHKYKDKSFKKGEGFTVFGVSLDKTKADWENAVKEDSLIWNTHVSDLKGWSSRYASVYGVRSIPSNFLIDGDGTIVAKNLRGRALEETLEQLLK